VRSEACRAALSLSLNSYNSAANKRNNKPYGNGKNVYVACSLKIKY
jgi:hypothetical protein